MPSSNKTRLTTIKKKISRAPLLPGVYQWLSAEGKVLYVGKAKDLRARLKSYLTASPKELGPWKVRLLEVCADVRWTVTKNELEALLLETTQIKELLPKYNVLMKDGKNFVYLKVRLQDPYPSIDVVRKIERDGSKYFGPFLRAQDLHRSLDLLDQLLRFKACREGVERGNRRIGIGDRDREEEEWQEHVTLRSEEQRDERLEERRACHPSRRLLRRAQNDVRNDLNFAPPQDDVLQDSSDALDSSGSSISSSLRPCLDSQIGRCNGLCAGKITQEEYRGRIEAVAAYFRGRFDGIEERAKALMQSLVQEKKFERAAEVRDALKTVQELREKQTVSDPSGQDSDSFGVALGPQMAHVCIVRERSGKVIGIEDFVVERTTDSPAEVLGAFIPQYIEVTQDFPTLVLLPMPISEKGLLIDLLRERSGHAIEVREAKRGKGSALTALAMRNALERVRSLTAQWESEEKNTERALTELRDLLSLPDSPKRIECYDISHTAGTETVGSMAVMIDGKPNSRLYRTFSIRTLKSGEIDDYASLKEVLKRRLRHVKGGLKEEEARLQQEGVEIVKEKNSLSPGERARVRGNDESSILYQARHDGDVLATLAVIPRSNNNYFLRVTMQGDASGERLIAFLLRKFFDTEKIGRAYMCVPPTAVDTLAHLQWELVRTVPDDVSALLTAEEASMFKDGEAVWMATNVTTQKPDSSLSAIPDLLVIDGGKGQLSVAVEVLGATGLTIPVCSLAKREEEVFVHSDVQNVTLSPSKSDALPSIHPIQFPNDSPGRFLLMHIRDEAHRFANRLREKKAKVVLTKSALDSIPAIGPDTRSALLSQFGSISGIKKASDAALLEILSPRQLLAIREGL